MRSRRKFLNTAAGTAIAALGSWPVRAIAEGTKPAPAKVMDVISAYMSAARSRALPDNVTEQAKYHLLDTIAAMISGSELPPGQAAQR